MRSLSVLKFEIGLKVAEVSYFCAHPNKVDKHNEKDVDGRGGIDEEDGDDGLSVCHSVSASLYSVSIISPATMPPTSPARLASTSPLISIRIAGCC